MNDVSTLPAASIPDAWDGVDTSIDTETPELLSEDQFDRYTETVAALLSAAGLDVCAPDSDDPGTLEITNPRTGHTVELDLRDDRSAEWTLTAHGETTENTPAVQIAMLTAGVLSAAEPRRSM